MLSFIGEDGYCTPKSDCRNMREIIVYIAYFLAGAVVTAGIVSVAHVAQGLITNDWSGLHPYNRFVQVPVIVMVAFAVALVSVFLFRTMGLSLNGGRDYFFFGLILGCSNIGVLLPRHTQQGYVSLFVFIGVLFVAIVFLFVRAKKKM